MLNYEHLRTIDELLQRREIKKAEVLIAKHLRSELPADEKIPFLVQRARARLLSARPDDALTDLAAARAGTISDTPLVLELFGDCHFARFELASMGFADRGDTEQALTHYRRILDEYPNYENIGWIHYQIGRVLLTDNHAHAAMERFQTALLAPSHVPALTAYCYERMAFVAFYEDRDPNRALSFIGKSVDTYPPGEDRRWLVQVHILRSRILREGKRFEQALRAAETALAVAASVNGENRASLAEAYLTVGELSAELGGRDREVIASLQQFLQVSRRPLGVDVTWSRVHEMLGDAYFRTGQHSSAVGAYNAALDFNPYHPWEISLYYRMARAAYQGGEYERTVQIIERMLARAHAEGEQVSDYRVYDILGNAQFALKQYAGAVDAYRTALHIAPPNADNLDKIRTYYGFAQELSRA
jgi:tetratricopeptide (TPR) repeat protein